MIYAQTPLMWPEILNHSVSVGIVLFFGLALTWMSRRLFGNDGIITKSTERNSETMEKYGDTLVELKELNKTQQTLCSAHTGSMGKLEAFSEKMVELHTDPNSVFSTVGIKEKLEVLDRKITDAAHPLPVLEAMLHCVDTAETLGGKCSCDCSEELRSLREKIERLKQGM